AAPRVQCCTERPRRIFLVVPARGRLVSEKFDIRRDPCYADAHKCDFRPMSTRSILRADRLKRLFEPDPADFGKDQDRLRRRKSPHRGRRHWSRGIARSRSTPLACPCLSLPTFFKALATRLHSVRDNTCSSFSKNSCHPLSRRGGPASDRYGSPT